MSDDTGVSHQGANPPATDEVSILASARQRLTAAIAPGIWNDECEAAATSFAAALLAAGRSRREIIDELRAVGVSRSGAKEIVRRVLDRESQAPGVEDAPAEPMSEVDQWRTRTERFLAVGSDEDYRALYDLVHSDAVSNLSTLREAVVEGRHDRNSAVQLHRKDVQEQWHIDQMSLEKFAKSNFAIGVLYRPVFRHAMGGLMWGSLIGMALNALDKFIGWLLIDPPIAFFYAAVVAAFIKPRIGIIALVLLLIATRGQYDIFPMLLGVLNMAFLTAVVGAVLGGPAGMGIGALAGWIRRGRIPQARDAKREGAGTILALVILPLLIAAAIHAAYFLVINPLVMSWLEEQAPG